MVFPPPLQGVPGAEAHMLSTPKGHSGDRCVPFEGRMSGPRVDLEDVDGDVEGRFRCPFLVSWESVVHGGGTLG